MIIIVGGGGGIADAHNGRARQSAQVSGAPL